MKIKYLPIAALETGIATYHNLVWFHYFLLEKGDCKRAIVVLPACRIDNIFLKRGNQNQYILRFGYLFLKTC